MVGQQARQPRRKPGLDQDLREVLQGDHLHRPGGPREVPEDHGVRHDRTPTRLLHAHGEAALVPPVRPAGPLASVIRPAENFRV